MATEEEEERKWNEREEGLAVVVGESARRRGVAEEVAEPPETAIGDGVKCKQLAAIETGFDQNQGS